MKNFYLAVFLCLLVATSFSLTTYTHTFDSSTTDEPYYILGFINAGNSIQINLTMPGITTNDFTGLTFTLQDQNQIRPPLSVSAAAGCQAGDAFCTMTFDITTNDNYVLTIVEDLHPAENDGSNPISLKFFYLQVTSFLTSSGGPKNAAAVITTIYKNTEVFRDKVTRLIYIQSKQKLSFSLWPVPDNAGSPDIAAGNLYLFSANNVQDSGSTYAMSGNNYLIDPNFFSLTTWTPANRKLVYDQLAPTSTSYLPAGFYVLTVTFTPLQNPVRLTFDSENYICPFDSTFPDYFKNFQPCKSSLANQAGFPCIKYDNVNMQCLTCFTGYSLINGSCNYNDTCPDRQYFEFGKCLPVNDACDTYDAFTGFCLTCKINASTIENGVCQEIPVVCEDRQYKVNNVCQNVSSLCEGYNITSGVCTSCVDDYKLQDDGTCEPIVINCSDNQYQVNKDCINIPKECTLFFKAQARCMKCVFGWWPSSLGVCQKIICPPREVPSEYGFFCVKVSPLCDEYDERTGNCINCTHPDMTVQDGKCRSVVNPLAGCQERQRLGYGPCASPLLNCEQYNLITKNCHKCVEGWYKDYKGECSLKKKVCEADEVNIQEYCQQVPPNCAEVDKNGFCSVCKGNYDNVFGMCVMKKTCPDYQYKTSTGVCVDITPGCGYFNPTTGQCLKCKDGSDAKNGLCCPSNYYVFGGRCIDAISWRSLRLRSEQSKAPVCMGYHPTLGHCLECNGRHKPNPINPKTCI